MGMQNGTATLDDCLAVSYKTKHTLTIESSSHVPWYLYKGDENLRAHKNQQLDAYGSFIHNCQNVETTKMPFSRGMGKLLYIQTVEYYSPLKRNDLSSHEKTWMKLKCISIHVIIHLSKSIECTTPRVNPNINYGRCVKMMCPCRFIDCNKCTTLVRKFCSEGRLCVCGTMGCTGNL